MAEETQLQPTKPSVPNEGQTVVLNDEEVLEISVDETARDYKENSSRAGQQYHIFTFRGARGTCPPKFFEKMEEGDVLKATLTKGSYVRKVPDPNNANQTFDVITPTWQLDSFATSTQIINLLDKQEKVMEKRMNLEAIKSGAKAKVATTALTDEIVGKLKDAI
jgi:hypothetical protein